MNNEDRLAETWHAPGLGEVHSDNHQYMIYCTEADENGEDVPCDELANRVREALAAHEASRESGLEWSKTLCGGKPVDYETAAAACKSLGEGWRLPTRMELESILDLTRHDPAVDTERFPDTKSEWYWTSMPCAWASCCAWIVDFDYGDAYYHLRSSEACVRAVRSLPGWKVNTAAKGEVSDEWFPGWYATRLHAVVPSEDVAEWPHASQAVCGAPVYKKAPTKWAQRRVDRGVPHCKRCERILAARKTGGSE